MSICKIMTNVYLLNFGNSLINFIMTPLGNESKMNSSNPQCEVQITPYKTNSHTKVFEYDIKNQMEM